MEKKNKEEKKCKWCGKPLKKYQEDICSWDCNDAWEQDKVVKERIYD